MPAPLPPATAWLVPLLDSAAGADPSTSVRCWVMSLAPGTFVVRAGGSAQALAQPQSLGSYGRQRIFTCLVQLSGLSPDTVYDLSLQRSGVSELADRARVRTWPARLGASERPFQLLLGSCFSTQSRSRGGGQVGGLVRALSQHDSVPHLKVLCGDQVYLDSPLLERVPDTEPEIRELLLGKYLANWGARDSSSSQFGALLRTGTNLLLSDDHEFWNNYPMPAVYAPRLAPALGGAQRAGWFAQAASDLLAQFQGVPPLFRHHRLGELSLISLDGRRQRTASRAHSTALLAALRTALQQATGPVLLVLSQPLFEPAAARRAGKWWRSHVTDLVLADLTDYRELVQLLADSGKDILVLSGDIHGGRVCSVRSATQNIFEVVASPLSLVTPYVRYRDEFPTDEYPDLDGRHPKYSAIRAQLGPVTTNHGALLSLARRGDTLAVSVEFLESQSGQRLKLPGSPTFYLRSPR